MIDSEKPIGIFDSGIGGLSVLRAVREVLPEENLIYFGDNARVPYGTKSPETINRYARQITEFLLTKEVKLLIIACNTMSAVARETVTQTAALPVLDVIEAGAKMARTMTQNGRIGVIGTRATIKSRAYVKALRSYGDEVEIFCNPCPLLVPLIEEGWFDHPATRLTAEEYLRPLLGARIDTLILGCTHYPFLKPLIREIVGPDVTLVDSAEAVAADTQARLHELGIGRKGRGNGRVDFFVTDAPEMFCSLGEGFLRTPISRIELVQL